MTVGEWLDRHAATAPVHLMQQVRGALGTDLDADAAEAPERCVAAANRMVSELLAAEETGRESALALLAADALVTFAFEAAADDPARVRGRAADAMRQLAAGV